VPPGSVGDRPEHKVAGAGLRTVPPGSVGDRPEHKVAGAGLRTVPPGSVGDRPEHFSDKLLATNGTNYTKFSRQFVKFVARSGFRWGEVIKREPMVPRGIQAVGVGVVMNPLIIAEIVLNLTFGLICAMIILLLITHTGGDHDSQVP
jgi:hypothetical protein